MHLKKRTTTKKMGISAISTHLHQQSMLLFAFTSKWQDENKTKKVIFILLVSGGIGYMYIFIGSVKEWGMQCLLMAITRDMEEFWLTLLFKSSHHTHTWS